jgi:hypothetical protein
VMSNWLLRLGLSVINRFNWPQAQQQAY